MARYTARVFFGTVRLGLLLVLGHSLSAQAQAQTVPEPLQIRPQVDGRGVDLANGRLTVGGLASVSIGQPGAGGLAYSLFYFNDGLRDTTLGTISRNGSLYTVSAGGSAASFTRSGNTFSSNEGAGATLTVADIADPETGAFTQRRYTYTDVGGVVYIFESTLAGGVWVTANEAVLVSVTAPTGDRMDYNYNAQIVIEGSNFENITSTNYYRLQSITNNLGYQIHFEYSVNGSLGSLSASDVPAWQRATKVTAFDTTVDNCSALANTCSFSRDWPEVTYGYSSNRLTTITDAIGRVTRLSYDGQARLTRVNYPGTNLDDLVYGYESGASRRVTSVSAIGQTWSYNYGTNGGNNIVTVTSPVGDTERITSSISTGLVSSIRDGVNETTTYAYDSDGRLERVTAPEGNFVDYTYDARGNITRTEIHPKPGSGDPVLVTVAAYSPSCSNPVTCNQPGYVTDAYGQQTFFSYSPTHGGVSRVRTPAAAGQGRQRVDTIYSSVAGVVRPVRTTTCVTAETCSGSANEQRATISYDSKARPVSTTVSAGNGALAQTTSITYNIYGDVERTDGPLPGSSDRSYAYYDALRRPIGVIGPDPDGGGPLKRRATRFDYFDHGGVQFTRQGVVTGTAKSNLTNGLSSLAITANVYDGYGRPVWERNLNGSFQALSLTQVQYDDAGRPECSAVRMNAAFPSPPGACTLGVQGSFGPDRISRTVYDGAGRPVRVVSGDGTSAAITEETAYTNNGLTAWVEDGRGNRTTFTYDGHDRLKRTTYPDGDYEENTYDSGGRLVSVRRRNGAVFNFSYDVRGRITNFDVPDANDDVAYTYDVAGRLLSAQGRFDVTREYDVLGRLTSETSRRGAVRYQYDSANRRTRMTWPDNFYVTYAYDVTGAVTGIFENGSTSGDAQLARYKYNDLGQRTEARFGNNRLITTYGYDALNRLDEMFHNAQSGAGHDQRFTFDYNPAGQIVRQTGSNGAYAWQGHFNDNATASYNINNELTSIGGASVVNDNAENIISSPRSTGGTISNTFDSQKPHQDHLDECGDGSPI